MRSVQKKKAFTRQLALIALVLLFGFDFRQCADVPESSFQMSWGKIEFRNGMPAALSLDNGSGMNLLGASGISYIADEGSFNLNNDSDVKIWTDGKFLLAEAVLTSPNGKTTAVPVSCKIRWEVSEIGFIRGEIRLYCAAGFNGRVAYDFGFNSRLLDRYYTTGFFPDDVRKNTSLKKPKMDCFDRNGKILHFHGDIIDRIIGMVHSETEALNIAAAKGFFDEVIVRNHDGNATMTFVSEATGKKEITATFYILPSPVQPSANLLRVYTAQHNGITKVGVENFVDTMVEDGFRYFIYHEEWQLPKPQGKRKTGDTDVLYGSHRPRDMRITQELLRRCHEEGIKILFYVGLVNEDNVTQWYLENDGERYAMQHCLKGRASERRIMCLNTPYYEHLIDDTDYILDSLNADGVYIDWFTLLGCSQPHASHEGIPISNINKLIEYTEYVKSKNKQIMVHSGEESRMAFLEDIADEYIIGERAWSILNYETIEDGLFDRWSSSVGKVAIINDSRWQISDAQHQIEINAALAEGLNPFGYVYRPATYDMWRDIPDSEIHSNYVFDILRRIRHIDIESMSYAPDNSRLLRSNDPQIIGSLFYDDQQVVCFVINKDLDETIQSFIQIDLERMGLSARADYRVKVSGAEGQILTGRKIIDGAIQITVPANCVEIIEITNR